MVRKDPNLRVSFTELMELLLPTMAILDEHILELVDPLFISLVIYIYIYIYIYICCNIPHSIKVKDTLINA
jgi:hypothetical protein